MAKRIAINPGPGVPTRRGGFLVAAFALSASLGWIATTHVAAGPIGSTLDQLRWLRDKARPIVIVSDAADDSRVAEQVSALDHVKRGLAERDIIVLREARTGGALRVALGLPDHGFAVVLVGKDGSVKEVWHAPVEPGRVFALVDAMPMRRHEIHGQGTRG